MERDHEAVGDAAARGPRRTAPHRHLGAAHRRASQFCAGRRCSPRRSATTSRGARRRRRRRGARGEQPQRRLGADERQTFPLPREAVSNGAAAGGDRAAARVGRSAAARRGDVASTVGADVGAPRRNCEPNMTRSCRGGASIAAPPPSTGDAELPAARERCCAREGIRDRREAIEGRGVGDRPRRRSPRWRRRGHVRSAPTTRSAHARHRCARFVRARRAARHRPGRRGARESSTANSLAPEEMRCLAASTAARSSAPGWESRRATRSSDRVYAPRRWARAWRDLLANAARPPASSTRRPSRKHRSSSARRCAVPAAFSASARSAAASRRFLDAALGIGGAPHADRTTTTPRSRTRRSRSRHYPESISQVRAPRARRGHRARGLEDGEGVRPQRSTRDAAGACGRRQGDRRTFDASESRYCAARPRPASKRGETAKPLRRRHFRHGPPRRARDHTRKLPIEGGARRPRDRREWAMMGSGRVRSCADLCTCHSNTRRLPIFTAI